MYTLITPTNEAEFLTLGAAMKKMFNAKVPSEIIPSDEDGDDPPIFKKIRIREARDTYFAFAKCDASGDHHIEDAEFLQEMYQHEGEEITEPEMN